MTTFLLIAGLALVFVLTFALTFVLAATCADLSVQPGEDDDTLECLAVATVTATAVTLFALSGLPSLS